MTELDDFAEKSATNNRFSWLWKIERVLIGIAIFGVLFKIQHYPGAGLMLVISLTCLSLISMLRTAMPIGATSKLSKIANAAGSFGGSIAFVGLLFKIQHYPGASVMMMNAIILLSAAFILSFIKSDKTALLKDRSLKRFGTLIIAWLLVQFNLVLPARVFWAANNEPPYASFRLESNGECFFRDIKENVSAGTAVIKDRTITGTVVTERFGEIPFHVNIMQESAVFTLADTTFILGVRYINDKYIQ
jgi:hypothetical protein